MVSDFLFGNKEVSSVHMVGGKGMYLWDSSGKKYFDACAGTFNLSLGYQHEEVLNAVKDQMEKLVHCTSSYATDPVNNLAEWLVKTSPANLTKAHIKVSGGSTAIEGAIKLAQYYTGKKEIISFYRSHHGQTIYAMELSGFSFRREPFSFSKDGIIHVPFPYLYQNMGYTEDELTDLSIRNIEEAINYSSSNNIAAVIIEPILGNGGNVLPTNNFLPRLRQLCDEKNMVLIFDEVQTGIGRTGHMYASDYFGVSPDIMVVAKGLGGTGFQVAAILLDEKLNGMPAMHHSFTYGSNLVSCAAGCATLRIVSQPAFLSSVRQAGHYLRERLGEFSRVYPFIGDVRGAGLMIGFEIVESKISRKPDPALTNKIARACFEKGLILRTSEYGKGNVLKVRPSLNVSSKECEELCSLLEAGLQDIAKQL